jgi:hypothetical protein
MRDLCRLAVARLEKQVSNGNLAAAAIVIPAQAGIQG